MPKRLTIKDHQQESRLFNRRSLAALIIVLGFATLLFSRLAYLQIFSHQRYSTLSQQNLLEILPIEPNRGLIFDRNGILLAKNVPAFNLNLIPSKVHNINKTLTTLKRILPISDNDIHAFKRNLRQHRPYESIPLKLNLNEKELAVFYINRYRLPGVMVQTKMRRTYPLGKTMSNVVGYVGRINTNELTTLNHINYSASEYIGKTGIEKYYEKTLHGKVGVKEVEINASGNIIRNIKRKLPIPGNNLYLTIDSRLQAYAEKALGNNNGAIVVIQPNTGQILALVTKPNFDPNLFVNGISHRDYEKLSHSPNHPLFNRAILGQYAPASTIKPFIAIAGLNQGTITIRSRVYDPGWFRLPGSQHIYHDWKHSGHGWVNVIKAITVSCDTFFYHLAVKLGIHSMDHMLSQFGFGKHSAIDMPEELPGLVPSPAWKRQSSGHPWYTADTVLIGIGQSFLLVTPLQLAEATAMLAERGARYQPHLLLKSQRSDDTFTLIPSIEKPPLVLENPKIWDEIIHAMETVISSPNGTAEAFGRHPSYTVAAKTGTAQVFRKQHKKARRRTNIPKRLRNNHLFISFAPVKHPKIALAIVIEHASYADKIARHVMDFYFNHCDQQDKEPT